MAANICPICSGEIMTYRRFLKVAEPSEVSVCQCCGARLKRHKGAHKRILVASLGLAAVTFALGALAYQDVVSPLAALVTVLALAVGLAVVMAGLGLAKNGWVALDDPAKSLGAVPPGRLTHG